MSKKLCAYQLWSSEQPITYVHILIISEKTASWAGLLVQFKYKSTHLFSHVWMEMQKIYDGMWVGLPRVQQIVGEIITSKG
jgi:hypothetical protein